ncbi:uncharacterized protein [Watersipora subatra]|uniref:uncharacterized protein isoform X3 n=1 Tax=Watersipora subatra TaxID=2589382 RepID=UPI00355BA4A5
MDSLKPESESDSTFTGSDEDALSGVSTMDLLEWLKSLSKLCPHVFDISLCILPIDKTLKEKLVEIFVDFIAKQQNYRERTREITKGWDKTEQLVNALGLLKTFTLKNIREWKQSNRDEIQRSINRTSSAQRKMLRQSLGNALKEEKGGSFFLPGDKFFFQEKSLKNPQEILEMEADLQKNAIEILPNCEKRILTLIKDELATMFPGLDNFRNELIDLFGRHPAEEIDIKTLLKAKFKKPHEITPHSVEKLLMEEDEKDEFYEALFAVLYQPASKDKEIERSLQVARQSACKDGEKKLPQCARQYKKAVESCLSETLLHCDEAFLELFINELKTHAISKAIFAVPFTTRSANSTAMKREKVTSKQ